jgi:hypothetical protein
MNFEACIAGVFPTMQSFKRYALTGALIVEGFDDFFTDKPLKRRCVVRFEYERGCLTLTSRLPLYMLDPDTGGSWSKRRGSYDGDSQSVSTFLHRFFYENNHVVPVECEFHSNQQGWVDLTYHFQKIRKEEDLMRILSSVHRAMYQIQSIMIPYTSP